MIIVDTREKNNTHIIDFLKKNNIEYKKQCLKFADYTIENSNIYVERKKDLIEFAGNCGKNHARFKRLLEKSKNANAKLTILIEQPIMFYKVQHWYNPQGRVTYRRLKNGQIKAIQPISGKQIFAIMNKWINDYDIQVRFCDKKDSGQIIMEILKGETK